MSSLNNTTANFEPWFIIINISIITSLVIAILLAIIFLIIVALHKTCHTVPIMLTANICLAEIVYGSVTLSVAVFTFENDQKQRVYQDTLCAFRGYLLYVGTAFLLYSFALQAIYQYIVVVYPARISWRSTRVQCLLICIVWIFCILSFLPWLLTGAMRYSADNQICLALLQLSVPVIYNMLFAYSIPISIIALIYLKLVRYVRQMGNRATAANTIFQARRDLTVVRRIVIIIIILLMLGLLYVAFIFMSFITPPPKYHLRMAFFPVDFAQTLIMIAVFKFCQPVMDVVLKYKRVVVNRVQPTIT